MKKKVFMMMILAMVLFLPAISMSVTQTFSWFPNMETDLDGYAIHIRHIFEDYDTSYDSWDGMGETYINDNGQERIRCTIDGFGNGIFYLVIIAYDTSGNRSDFSNEVRIQIDNDSFVYGEVSYVQEDSGVRFTLPDTDEIGVAGYHIYYTTNGITETVDIGTATEYFLELDEALYTFDVVPYNDIGDEYEAYSPSWNYFWPPLEAPDIKVEYVGIGISKVLAGLALNDQRVEKYDYYLSSSMAKAEAGEADIAEGSTYNRNIIVDVSSVDYDMVFVTIVPVNETNQIFGDSEIAYVLFGNIIGTYNDGVAWDVCDVGYSDYNVLKGTYGSHVNRLEIDDYGNYDLYYEILPFTLIERADMDGEGNVLYPDYNFLKLKYGNIGTYYAE